MSEPNVVLQLLESSFTTALVGSLAGAFAGAYAAQRISERSKKREQLIQDIRCLNAATALAHGIANSAMSTKKQHVAPSFAAYSQEIERHGLWLQSRLSGQVQGNTPFDLKMDLQTIPKIKVPVKPLQDLVFTFVPSTPLIVNLTLSLTEFLELLETAMNDRDRQISEFRRGIFPAGASNVDLYLGLPYAEGHVNNEFGSALNAINSYVDDVIFFSSELALRLTSEARHLQSKFRIAFSDVPPKVLEVDLRSAQEAGLLPAREKYEGWLEGFSGKGPATP